MIELRFELDPSVINAFEKRAEIAAKEFDVAIIRIANKIRNEAIDAINKGERHGRLYKRRGVLHRASAKGEFPKTDTGRLVNSIRIDREPLRATIGSDLNYAGYLETKSPDHGGRPWLSRVYHSNEDDIQNEFKAALERIFK